MTVLGLVVIVVILLVVVVKQSKIIKQSEGADNMGLDNFNMFDISEDIASSNEYDELFDYNLEEVIGKCSECSEPLIFYRDSTDDEEEFVGDYDLDYIIMCEDCLEGYGG